MTEKFSINPFDRSALTDIRQLAGRSDEFRQIRFVLRNSAKTKNRIRHILITGDRGVGKTSLLNLIEAECEINNIIAIRVDLTESNSSTSCDFFWHLFVQALNKLFKLGYFDGKGGAIDSAIQGILNSDGAIDPANWVFNTPLLRKNFLINQNSNFEFEQFVSDLKIMRNQLISLANKSFNEQTKLLFLVDESQQLYSNKKIIEEIRFVIQSQDLGVGFVFSGDTTYKKSEWELVFGGSYREFEIISLGYFNSVDSVIDYFKKSLSSIDWTEEEITESLFYRFKLACKNIYKLTSGKPAWINTIAMKMFERCMSGEVKQMRFDKQAQLNVKQMLEDSGELDKKKLEFIESLSPEQSKWLSELFASELYSFKQVYFYAKFKLTGEQYLGLKEYEMFCKELVDRKIINLLKPDEIKTIGFKNSLEESEFLESHYYAFELRSDATKQWLQISSEGNFRFGYKAPASRFMTFINNDLAIDQYSTILLRNVSNMDESPVRISELIEEINQSKFDVNEQTFDFVSEMFKLCKMLENSRDREILFVQLLNNKTRKSENWNIYNCNDKDKLLPFRESQSAIKRLQSVVEKYNTEISSYSLLIAIDKVAKPNLNSLQKLIIETNDSKKIGIVLEDKMDDLIRLYIRESNVDSSYEIASFFYNLFEKGHDLNIRYLNNSGYVFIEKHEFDKAELLLSEAKRKIVSKNVGKEDTDDSAFVYYNLALLKIFTKDYNESLKRFRALLDFYEEYEISDDGAGVLKVLCLNEKSEIEISEVKHVKKNESSKLKCKEYVAKNIEILEQKIAIDLQPN